MPAYNFKPWIVPKIEDGTKPGTVRLKRKKNPTKVGDPLYLYTGMRTKQCKKISDKVCYGLFDIRITKTSIYLNECALYEGMKESFSKWDGFDSYADFRAFFLKQYGLPFSGEWIVWNSKYAQGANEYIQAIKKQRRKVSTDA